jgi:hypothetical protein
MVEEILDGVNGVLWLILSRSAAEAPMWKPLLVVAAPAAHSHRRLGLQLAGQLHVRPAGAAAGRHAHRHGGGVRQFRREPAPAEPSTTPGELGRGTTDEMAIVFIGITADAERIGWRPPAK